MNIPPITSEQISNKIYSSHMNNVIHIPTNDEINQFVNAIKNTSEVDNNYFNAILNKVVDVQQQHSLNVQDLKTSFEKVNENSLNVSELIKIQMSFYQLTLSLDLAAKMTSKLPQSIEILMRG